MDDEFEQVEKVFTLVLEADRRLWAAVLQIRDGDIAELERFVQLHMNLRGEIHMEFLRPMYKKFPELAATAGFDAEKEQ